MIQTIETHQCPKCGSENMVKKGHDYKGSQKYHCKACGRYGTLQAQPGHSEQVEEQVKRAFLERVSLRGIERIFELSRRTVSRWLERWVNQLPSLADRLAPARPDDILELDELWSFVARKDNKRWVWVALCRRRGRWGLITSATAVKPVSTTLATDSHRLCLVSLLQ